jgi:DNA modification methylase
VNTIILHTGDCREVLASIPDNSIDVAILDPPYELNFMGKIWDGSGIALDAAVWSEVFRVLKPDGVLKAFGGTRTFHRLAVALELAGFEGIGTNLEAWTYGSGFPKSLNVAKALRKKDDPDLAKKWEGYGTALKPAWEPVLIGRKPG